MEEDERREAAIASAPSLQPNFMPKSEVMEAQLSKFHELHKRRLQIKERTKTKKKIKGIAKCHEKDDNAKERLYKVSSAPNEGLNIPFSQDSIVENSSVQESLAGHPVSTMKQQKLHWGLDTKERWEMKANM